MTERIDDPLFLQEYRLVREQLQDSEIPKVSLYRLSIEEERERFLGTLVDFPTRAGLIGWSSKKPTNVLLEALQRGVVLDRYNLQLIDYAETHRASFKKNERALSKFVGLNDTFNNGTIAEYPWKDKARFVRVLDEEAFASVIYSRNRFVIPDEVQESFREDVFAAGGLAVGGNTAYLFMLSGVENWVVADGGLLDLHDFNRVIGAKVEDIGVNQAIRWTKMALDRDPFLNIRSIPSNLGKATDKDNNIIGYDVFLGGVDRVIEALDEFPVKGGLRKKTNVIMPTDLGMGAKVEEDVMGRPFHGRLSVEEMDDLLNPEKGDLETKTQLAIRILGLDNIPPAYLAAVREARENKVPFWPQPGVAAFLSAAMMVAREVALRSGLPVKEEAAIDLIKEVTLLQ